MQKGMCAWVCSQLKDLKIETFQVEESVTMNDCCSQWITKCAYFPHRRITYNLNVDKGYDVSVDVKKRVMIMS